MGMIKPSTTALSISVLSAVMALASPASATELVYVPVNPNFGGSPLNGNMLLSNAQAQDRHKDKSAGQTGIGGVGSGQTSEIEQFNQLLKRSILSRVAAAASSSLVDSSGSLLAGELTTDNFKIVIADIGGGYLEVTTTDILTGQTTSFKISQNF